MMHLLKLDKPQGHRPETSRLPRDRARLDKTDSAKVIPFRIPNEMA